MKVHGNTPEEARKNRPTTSEDLCGDAKAHLKRSPIMTVAGSVLDVVLKDMDTTIAWASPVLYMVYVEIAKRVLPYESKENKHIFHVLRLVHNVGLAIASLVMLIGILAVSHQSGKLNSIHAALCDPFLDVESATLVGRYFYLSKYWEWVDTAFLITARKD
eukprot:gene13749-15817_t